MSPPFKAAGLREEEETGRILLGKLPRKERRGDAREEERRRRSSQRGPQGGGGDPPHLGWGNCPGVKGGSTREEERCRRKYRKPREEEGFLILILQSP